MGDGEEILSAVCILKDRFGKIVDFSNRYWNYAIDPLDIEDAKTLCIKAVEDHSSWDADIESAFKTLKENQYPFPVGWWLADLSIPQVCFCSEVRNEVYVFGSGDNPLGEKTPSDGSSDMEAGEWRGIDRDFTPTGEDLHLYDIGGTFNDWTIRQLEKVLDEIGAVERDLVHARLTWEPEKHRSQEESASPIINTGRNGKKIGPPRGGRPARPETKLARKLIGKGKDRTTIQQLTNLSKGHISALKSQLKAADRKRKSLQN